MSTPTTTQPSADQIFRAGSTTYYQASRFFSPAIRHRVEILYAFVRVADNFVDTQPQQIDQLNAFIAEYHEAVKGAESTNSIIANFVSLQQQVGIKTAWVDAFFASMLLDETASEYASLQALSQYIYGSAEVIGLMLARIMGIASQHDSAARMLGKAMQYCNMLRDVGVDLELGRVYIPSSVLKKYQLYPLSKEVASKRTKAFARMMRAEVARCLTWFDQAEAGIRHIPRRERAAVRTATAMYRWTLQRIARQPNLALDTVIKPSKARIVLTACWYMLVG